MSSVLARPGSLHFAVEKKDSLEKKGGWRKRARGSERERTKEAFYARASWLSTTKILSITEKRILLNSPGIDIHSEACYVKVTGWIRLEKGEGVRERMRIDQAAAWL